MNNDFDKVLLEQREQIQEDLLCILDDTLDSKTMIEVCQVVVDGFEILIQEHNKKSETSLEGVIKNTLDK